MGRMSEEWSERHAPVEQRSGERSPIELKVEYERMNTFFYDYTRNISRGGTFVQTDEPLAIGTRFLFRMFVPGLREPLRLEGEVRWIRPPGDPAGAPGMGLQFIFSNDRHRADVDALVEKLMVGSLGRLISNNLHDWKR
jgi:type IV pilus assembly protein PilZ